MYSGKRGFLRTKWLYTDKVVVSGQSGCIGAKVVLFGQQWLYSGKSGYNRAKVVVFA